MTCPVKRSCRALLGETYAYLVRVSNINPCTFSQLSIATSSTSSIRTGVAVSGACRVKLQPTILEEGVISRSAQLVASVHKLGWGNVWMKKRSCPDRPSCSAWIFAPLRYMEYRPSTPSSLVSTSRHQSQNCHFKTLPALTPCKEIDSSPPRNYADLQT